jgi:hypothetical protein
MTKGDTTPKSARPCISCGQPAVGWWRNGATIPEHKECERLRLATGWPQRKENREST